MKYLLINHSDGNMQLNLHSPVSNAKHGLHRGGPVLALNIPRGLSVDLLKHFSSLTEVRAVLRASKDVLRLLQPGRLIECLLHDNGQQIMDIDAYLKNPTPPSPPPPLRVIPVPTKEEVVAAGYPEEAATHIIEEQKEKSEVVNKLQQTKGRALTDEEVVEALKQHEEPTQLHHHSAHEDVTLPAMEVAAVLAFEERKKMLGAAESGARAGEDTEEAGEETDQEASDEINA